MGSWSVLQKKKLRARPLALRSTLVPQFYFFRLIFIFEYTQPRRSEVIGASGAELELPTGCESTGMGAGN